MTAQPGLGVTGNGVGVTTPLAHRLAQSGLVAKAGGTRNLIRPGLFYDGASTIVTGTAGMSYDVAAFTAALTRGAGQGTVLLANDGTVNVPTTAAPGSNSRIDIVYVWQRDFAIDGTDSNPVIGVVQGSPAASPAAPSLAAFPGALELARITVPAGVTATNTGTTITQTAPLTAAAGGSIPVLTVSALPSSSVEGQRAVVLDTGIDYRYTGSAWVAQYEEIATPITASGGYTITGQQLRRDGKTVYISFQVTKTTNWAGTENIGTLNPAAIRPTGRIALGSGYTDVTGAAITVRAQTSGVIGLLGVAAGPGATVQFGCVSYVVP